MFADAGVHEVASAKSWVATGEQGNKCFNLPLKQVSDNCFTLRLVVSGLNLAPLTIDDLGCCLKMSLSKHWALHLLSCYFNL